MVKEYMMLDEISPNVRGDVKSPASDTSHSIIQVNLLNASAKWSEEISEPTLSNVSATLTSGQLLAVVGPVGAGKVGKNSSSMFSHRTKTRFSDVSDSRDSERAAFDLWVVGGERTDFVRRAGAVAVRRLGAAEYRFRRRLQRKAVPGGHQGVRSAERPDTAALWRRDQGRRPRRHAQRRAKGANQPGKVRHRNILCQNFDRKEVILINILGKDIHFFSAILTQFFFSTG
jgi:hypothetical protein